MATYIVYSLEEGDEILVEVSAHDGGIVPTSAGDILIRAKNNFSQALMSIKGSAFTLRKQLEGLKADEVEVKFGLKATGEAGNSVFAVGKLGVEANYEVTLKWKNKPQKQKTRK